MDMVSSLRFFLFLLLSLVCNARLYPSPQLRYFSGDSNSPSYRPAVSGIGTCRLLLECPNYDFCSAGLLLMGNRHCSMSAGLKQPIKSTVRSGLGSSQHLGGRCGAVSSRCELSVLLSISTFCLLARV